MPSFETASALDPVSSNVSPRPPQAVWRFSSRDEEIRFWFCFIYSFFTADLLILLSSALLPTVPVTALLFLSCYLFFFFWSLISNKRFIWRFRLFLTLWDFLLRCLSSTEGFRSRLIASMLVWVIFGTTLSGFHREAGVGRSRSLTLRGESPFEFPRLFRILITRLISAIWLRWSKIFMNRWYVASTGKIQ